MPGSNQISILFPSQEIDVKAGGGHSMMIGEMLRQWLVKLEWYSTLFPRIPVPVQKDISTKMKARNAEQMEQIQEPPRHITDEEVNFGEAEKYATNAATRRRYVCVTLSQRLCRPASVKPISILINCNMSELLI